MKWDNTKGCPFSPEERLVEDGLGIAPKFHALIAEVDGAVAGYGLFFDCYSSFQGSGIFLEDLFVRHRFQGKGIGRALLAHIAARVVELAYCGIMFNVLDWNQSALKFFESAGAAVSDRKTLCLAGARFMDSRSAKTTQIVVRMQPAIRINQRYP